MAIADVGTIAALWRYPVKSMMGEELNVSLVTEHGLLGDRAFALVDKETDKVASAKEPRKWTRLFDFRAAYVEPPAGNGLPPVRITLPDGMVVTNEEDDLDDILSRALGREVAFSASAPEEPSLEEYWPDIEGLDYRDTVTDEAMPEGTFFDAAVVHVLTTGTIDRLRELYPGGRFETRRFRPNVVVATESGDFVENDWVGRTLDLGDDVRLSVVKPCQRCVMTTLPQYDLPKDPGILRAAAQHNSTNVGVYAAVVRGGAMGRGDRVSVE
jgi:uncharacterized protein YcbX